MTVPSRVNELWREIADALETAYGCLTLTEAGIDISDLPECMAEVKAAKDKAQAMADA